MFGLLRAPKGCLNEVEFAQFQAHYCGLCHGLGRCGFMGLRMATSYDGTALALFFSGLAGEDVQIEQRACPFTPWRKKSMAARHHQSFDFAAKASLGLVKLKALDELTDGKGRLKQGVFGCLAKYLGKKAPDWQEFSTTGRLQFEAEAEKDPWLDELAYPSGFLLGSLAARAARENQKDSALAYRVGENLGKWIYLWDALWDLEDDIKAGRFNGLAAAYKLKVQRTVELEREIYYEIDYIFERSLAEVCSNLQSLDLGMPGEILVKLAWGSHNWHKQTFAKEFYGKEQVDERLPKSWWPGAGKRPA